MGRIRDEPFCGEKLLTNQDVVGRSLCHLKIKKVRCKESNECNL